MMEEGDGEGSDSDSTVLLDDYEQFPDKIAAKRRKLEEKYNAVAVTNENVAQNHNKDYLNPLLRQRSRIEHQWLMHKYLSSSIRNSQNAKDVIREDQKIKRELLKQETDSTNDIDQDSKGQNESGYNVLDGVIVIEDSDDDSAVETNVSNDPNSQMSGDVLSQRYVDTISNIGRKHPKPRTINARRATTNQDSQPRLTVLKPAAINSRRATIHIETDINNLGTGRTLFDETNNANNEGKIVITDSQSNDAPGLNMPQAEQTTDANATNNDNIVIINSQSNDALQLNMPQVDETTIGTNEDNIDRQYNDSQELHVPQLDETTNATDKDDILTINSQCNDNTSKSTKTPEYAESSKTDTITDSLTVNNADIKGISNPEHTLHHSEGNNENVNNQRNRHKHKSKRNRKDKKKFIDSSENSSAIATSSESLGNNDRVPTSDLNHEDISKSHYEYSNPTEEVVNVYVDVNEISRKRLVVDITPERNTKKLIDNNIDQSNDSANTKNTETNYSTSCAVIFEKINVPAESDGQTIDESNINESVLGTNNQSVMSTNDASDNDEVFNEEIERVIKYQVGFCTLLKGNLEEYCQNKNRDSEKVKAYLKSIESLTNEIENLKALAYDGRVSADIRFACPICTRVSTYSINLLYSKYGNHNSVEKTNGYRCKFCSKMRDLYNSHLKKSLRNCKDNNEYEVGSKISPKNNQLNIASKTCDDTNNIEKPQDKDSRKLSKEFNDTFGCIPEVNTLGTDRVGHNNSSILGPDRVDHNNSFILGGITPSEVIEESNKVNKLQSNINLRHENDSATVDIDTPVDNVDTASVDNGKESVLYKSIDVLNAADNTLNKYATSTGGIDGSDTFDKYQENNNNEVVNYTSKIAEKETTVTAVLSVLSVQRMPCEVSPNIAPINNDNDDQGEITDNLNNSTTHILLNEKSNTFECITNVHTSATDITTDDLSSVLQNISSESERNDSNYIENLVTDDDKLNCLNSYENVRQINKRKIKDLELKMVFKRIKTAENAINIESSIQKEQLQDKCGQDSSNKHKHYKKSKTSAEQKTFSKHSRGHEYKIITNELGKSNASDIRSCTQKVSNHATTNALIKKQNERSNERETDSELNETTSSHTEKQNINDVRNKTRENTETVDDKEKSQPAKNAKEVNNQRNSINGHEHKVPDNYGSNDANNDTDIEDQNMSVAKKLGEADTTNKPNKKLINEKDESLSKAQEKQLVSREENEKNKSSGVSDGNENRKQDASDNSSPHIDERSQEGEVETDEADTGDENSEDSAEESGTSDDESNNSMRKALDETFEKIKRNLNKILPPVAHPFDKPHKYLKSEGSNLKGSKISNQDKVNMKSNVQYMCNICSCIFTYGGCFLRHMMKHKLDLTKISKHCVKRKCSFCHVILREDAVNSHVRKFHPEEYSKVEDDNNEKKPKVFDQHNKGTFNYDNKKESIKKNGKCTYFCTLCQININSEYRARKHRKDKHPNMKNRKLYDIVSVDEIGLGWDEDNLNDSRNDTDDFAKDSDCDTNETCSKDSGSEYGTDEGSDKEQDTSNHDDEDSNCGDNCSEENGYGSGDNAHESCVDTDEECDNSSGQLSANNERDHENNDEGEYEANQSNEEASSDESETNRDDEEPRNDENATHHNILKTKYFFKCPICEVTLNSDYAVRKHRKEKHPDLKKKKFIVKVFINENNKPCIDENDKNQSGALSEKEGSDKEQDTSNHDDEDSNCGDNFSEENGYGSGDNAYESCVDTDEECDNSSGQLSANNERDHENNDEGEYEANQSNEEASSGESETNRDDEEHRNDENATRHKISRAKYFFKCPICEVTLNSDYAVRKHRKQNHPDLKKKKFIVKVYINENKKPCIDENDKNQRGALSEKEGSKMDENGSSSDKDHTDETKSDSECDANEVEESDEHSRRVLSEEEKDGSVEDHTDESIISDSECDGNEVNSQEISDREEVNSDIEQQGSDNYDTSDEEKNEQNTTNNSDESRKIDGIHKDHHKTASRNVQSDNRNNSKLRENLICRYKCTECDVILDSRYAVSKHRKDEHSNVKHHKWLTRKVWVAVKDQQHKPPIIISQEQQVTSDYDMRAEGNSIQRTSKENINSDNRNVLNRSTSDDIAEQCNDSSIHKINDPSVNDQIKDIAEDNTEDTATEARSDHETLIEEQSQSNENFDKTVDRDENTIDSIENKTNQNGQVAYKCCVCNEYFQSVYFMRIHREKDHPLMSNVRLFERVITKCPTETNILRNCYARGINFVNDMEHSCSSNHQTCIDNIEDSIENKTNQNGQVAYKCATIHKINDPSVNDHIEDIAEDNTEDTATEARSDHETLIEEQSQSNENFDKSVDRDENTIDSIVNKTNQNEQVSYKCSICNEYFQSVHFMRIHKEKDHPLMSNVRLFEKVITKCPTETNILRNCYACGSSFENDMEHSCSSNHQTCIDNIEDSIENPLMSNVRPFEKVITKCPTETNILRNCYACGLNFENDIEHSCSSNHLTCINNIEISNVTSFRDAYVFSCLECKYSTDVYDDFLRHCQNHYIEVVDTVKYCGTCELNFDEHRYDTHHNLHAKFEVIHFSYKSLFSNWDAIFDDIPNDVTTDLKTKSIYTTQSIRMAVVEDGPPEYSVYQCDQCKSCVPKLEIEKHCVSNCSDINYVCSVCDRAFISYEMRVNHEVMHRNGAKIFRVVEFNRREDRKNNLKLIRSRDLQKKDIKTPAPTAELFKCKCDLWYVTIEKFQKHIFECNSTCNGILCPKCHVTRIFLADELDKHLRLHHGEVVYEFVINEINIRRSLDPNEVKCETGAEHNEPTSTELDDAELELKREISKQEDDTIVISDDDD